MKYLIAQGNSRYNVVVVCKACKKEFTWLRLYKSTSDGEYIAMCAKCVKKHKGSEIKETEDNFIIETKNIEDGNIIKKQKRINKNHVKMIRILRDKWSRD